MRKLITRSLFAASCLFVNAQTRLITHLTAFDGRFNTTLLLINVDAEPAVYHLSAYDSSGTFLAQAKGMIAGHLTVAKQPVDLFRTEQASHVVIEPDTTLKIMASYRLKDGTTPAEVVETSQQSRRWKLFLGDGVATNDGWAWVNTGPDPATVQLTVLDSQGAEVFSQTVHQGMQPMSKGLFVVDASAFSAAGFSAILESDQLGSVMALRFLMPTTNLFWSVPAVPLGDEAPPQPLSSLTLFYTSDEHGWMEPESPFGGAPGLAGLWKTALPNDEPGLILSGGDMWTGPAISTWTRGESMVDVMNTMGYAAAAVGNHEFDFSLEGLKDRAEQAKFPFISANIRYQDTWDCPDFLLPYTILRVGDLHVGVVGLTTLSTPYITFTSQTGDYDFIDYAPVLEEVVPEVRAHGADLILVVSHVCGDELAQLAPLAQSLGVALITGGHCHDLRIQTVNQVPIVEAGSNMLTYAQVKFAFEPDGTLSDLDVQLLDNIGGDPDPEVQQVVDHWADATADQLNQVIGYASSEISRSSPALGHLLVDAWLYRFPRAEIAISNWGGIRQDIPAGDITLGTILGVFPFENALVVLQLTGQQIIANHQCCNPVLGGMTSQGGYALMDGTPIQPDQTYTVITTDYLYDGGAGFLFGDQDPDAEYTNMAWQQPLIDWLLEIQTNASDPLNNYLDTTSR